jgi:hypothetical protein
MKHLILPNNNPTDRPSVPETPAPGDVAVCAGCGGRLYKLSRNFYESCAFCGSRKHKRNPKRPLVCLTCLRNGCRLTPQGKTRCKDLVKRTKPVSKTRLATAGNGLGHLCGECNLFPTPADLIASFHGWKSHPCEGKKAESRACKKFVSAPPSLLPTLQPALSQCNRSEMKKNKPITLLYVNPATAEWMKSQAAAINQRHGGNLGLSTIARAVMTGLCQAKVDLGSLRGELDIQDWARKLASATANAEVNS